MSTCWDDYAYDMYMADRAEAELIENAIKDISKDSVKSYLGKHGDAIECRVKCCLEQADLLINSKYYGSSLSLSATAIEIIIRFFLLRPLVQGAFLSDEWADILSKRIVTGRHVEDKSLLPAVLENWDIDITKERLSNGNKLWDTILNKIWKKRNLFVHQASPIDIDEAHTALECANALMDIVNKIAKKLGFSLETTGKWHLITNKSEKGLEKSEGFQEETPFKD